MDYETIDNYKLSRLEILLNLFYQSKLKGEHKGQAIGITSLVTTLVVTGVLFIVGTLIFSQVNTAISGTGTGSESAANITIISGTVGTILDSFELGVIALIVLAAVAILAMLFTLGGTYSGRDDKDNNEEELDNGRTVSMETLTKKEEKFNNEYYKLEPDYDEGKKSFWDRFRKKGLK